MILHRSLCLRLGMAWLAALSLNVAAQMPNVAISPAAMPAVVPAVVPPEPVAPVGCRAISDQAMVIDLAAVTAQSKKTDLNEQAELFRKAMSLWSEATQQCDGRDKQRAVRNMEDDRQMLDRVTEKLASGPQCAAAHKDALVVQEIARQALSERRWTESAALFRKAANMWDAASERCTGSQRELANQHRGQSELDGHNAQFCAPLFEKAREQTQKLRSSAASLSREEKQDASMVAETLWRESLKQCKGSAVRDLATNNATALARERGTPWVARMPAAPIVAEAAQDSMATPSAAATSMATSVSASKSTATGKEQMNIALPSASNGAASAVSGGVALAAPVLAAPATAQPGDMTVGSTRFVGQFARDDGTTSISGNGKVFWATGDVYEGPLVKGLRHGRGAIMWSNGQRYEGDWVLDKPEGQARMHFPNGNNYEGHVSNGTPEGQGRMHYASGDVFDGQLKSGEPDLVGVYVWRNGQRFEGAWRDGRPNGQGKLKFVNANQYEGTVVNGVPEGDGRMVFGGGEVYVGQFHNGQPDGLGTFTWLTGDQYVGQWKAGKKNGHGVFTWKSGDSWEGTYEDDVQKN